ncbi:hypothetical protein BDN72DRAFT_895245 [Pluteus cervinus]|uniref:Uncharacterized protein n=1 Tax=Pluteus cervinus TaxID=181527 RepID=A0ACD3B1F6_9AGAR|nr:hypothetical protein BDN72DRAFT_895245 [Pluteus cervinus]
MPVKSTASKSDAAKIQATRAKAGTPPVGKTSPTKASATANAKSEPVAATTKPSTGGAKPKRK